MKLTLSLMLGAALARAACIQVSAERIRARDLFETVPMIAPLGPETLIGFAPLPGTQRTIAGHELMLIARQNGLAIENVPDVCVERALHAISETELRAALVEALNVPDARVELLDFSSQPLPSGHLEFPRSTLSLPPPGAPETPVIWRGRLIYDGRHSAVVWAKVRILVERTVCVAAEDIPAGALIHDRHVKAIKTRRSPFAGVSIDSPGDIIGKIARRGLRAGQNFLPAMLEEPKDVAKGDVIQVRVIDGLATLSLDGIAQSSGNKGDTILVHNSGSGRNFRAVIEEKGKAVVHSGAED